MFQLDQFIQDAKKQQINMDAVMVIQNGKELGFHRFSDDIYHNVFSISKSFTVTAIGMAIEEGIMSLSDKPCDMFADIMPELVSPYWQEITLKHLITMSTGHGAAHMMAKDRNALRGLGEHPADEAMQKEWLLFAFTRPIINKPGTAFCYGNLAPYVAGRMLEKATGHTMLDYLYEKLWKPLGVEKPRWDADPAGHTFPASDLFLDIRDMIKLGQIYLGKGEFEGRRYVSRKWVEDATSRQIDSGVINPCKKAEDETAGYGYYFWRNKKNNGYRAYGREGQFIIVLPEKNAVIAAQAMHSNVQEVLDLIWKDIEVQL